MYFFKRRFNYFRNSDLASIFESPNTVLLFPSDDALDIQDLPPLEQGYNILILDGTWTQAKGMYIHNPILHVPQKVIILFCDHIAVKCLR